jgi:uncharacterized protein (DUF2384 family)
MNNYEIRLRNILQHCLKQSEPVVPAALIDYMSITLKIPSYELIEYLSFPSSYIGRSMCMDNYLTPEESKKILGVFRIVSKVEHICESSCSLSGFDPGVWLGEWMRQVVPALNGKTPSAFLSTLEAQAVIESLLDCSVSGAYR